MDIFILRLPHQATQREVYNRLQHVLTDFGIETYSIDKKPGKNFAKLSILDIHAARLFLHHYGVPRDSTSFVQPRRNMVWNGVALRMWEDRHQISSHAVQALEYQAAQRAAERLKASRVQQPEKQSLSRFAIKNLKCGVWDYDINGSLAFTPYFEKAGDGTIVFGTRQAAVLLQQSDGEEHRLYFQYHDVEDIVLGSDEDPTVTLKLQVAPKFYKVTADNDLAAALSAMILGTNTNGSQAKKLRLTSLNSMHAKVVGTCFVYQVALAERFQISSVRPLLSRNPRIPATISLSTRTIPPTHTLPETFFLLDNDLTDQHRYGRLPFSILFQVSALAKNGTLHPRKVRALLPKIKQTFEERSLKTSLAALRRFATHVPSAGPGVEADSLSTRALQDKLIEFADDYDRFRYDPEDPYQLVERYQHINLIHKIVVTPTGVYLRGPYPEPTNRVLRRYAEHIDHFVRMVFQDEDSSSIRYDSRADQREVYDRFKTILENSVLVAGRAFSFLGFSHSSLRAQSVWCMSPIFLSGSLQLPEHILRALGDFSYIRIPAKCAARIGQNFTDTNATVDLREHEVSHLPMICRNGRDFADGVGTMSVELAQDVGRVYGTRRNISPKVFQIRYKGYKGMVSVDPSLRGKQLKLRDNMKKFEAPSAWYLEICGAGFRPLPMILNRQLIKILEDLGIGRCVFLEIQSKAVDQLRLMTGSAINTASFLEQADTTRATRVPHLIRKLGQIGLDYDEDPFLYRVVEMTVVAKLRDIKYRGRIPVADGVTLYGVTDETGYLREGEIYVTMESMPQGGRKELIKNNVMITRSPVMHPGDVQVINAVGVPADSPLRTLRNAVVFSQQGARDLPSMLSGGDLDGDLYNVIWDDRLVPGSTHEPADYPRVSAMELDRTVTRKDMSDFFVTFMQTDQLGMLSNIHLQLADQRSLGTLDPDCKTLAYLASVSVDFSKTGIPVEMKQCPRYDRIRPDFMAPSPRVFVEEQGDLHFEDEEAADEVLEDLEAEVASTRYYKSNKALGHLYRAIDEQQFLQTMQEEHEALLLTAASSTSLPEKLLQYMLRQAAQYAVTFDHHGDLAVEIRAGYEDSLLDILYQHGPSSHQPATECEAFAGCILGRKGGAQGKSLRELSSKMREQFESVCEYTIMRITKGDEQMRGVTDLDLLYEDEGLDREVEALPRAIACLKNGVKEEGRRDRRLGELQSFKYIAAGVCLRELERFRITTYGSSGLPRV